MPYYVYLVKCADKSLYCGYTRNLSKRVEAHNAGRGGRYTKAHRPVKLVYSEKQRTLKSAMQREREIKAYSRTRKKALIEPKSSLT